MNKNILKMMNKMADKIALKITIRKGIGGDHNHQKEGWYQPIYVYGWRQICKITQNFASLNEVIASLNEVVTSLNEVIASLNEVVTSLNEVKLLRKTKFSTPKTGTPFIYIYNPLY